nr:MAG TPA: HOLLIDAY JUNCTION RESOLVASE [Caudoviricetes sp.]
MEVKLIIGIDPDNKKSGVALVANTTREVKVMKMDFPSLIDYLRECKEIMRYPEVVIEGGWLNKSNWHVLGKYMSAQKAAAIGRNAGMNHQTGILLEEYCKHLELDVKVVKPLKKCWRGQDGKITQEEAEYFMGKLPRMNQDQRDALLLAWVYAGHPVKVKPKGGGNAK